MAKKILGFNFLHTHPGIEAKIREMMPTLDDREQHVLVDEIDLRKVLSYLQYKGITAEMIEANYREHFHVPDIYSAKDSVVIDLRGDTLKAEDIIEVGKMLNSVERKDPNTRKCPNCGQQTFKIVSDPHSMHTVWGCSKCLYRE